MQEYDVNGSATPRTVADAYGGGCESTGVYSAKVYRHRVGQDYLGFPDTHGPWVYPS